MNQSPHDLLFRFVFGQADHARGELCAVVPSVLAEGLDWSTLTLRPDSLVDSALTRQYTDLQYAAKWRRGEDREVLVCFLFEHQSTPPTGGPMGLRLLRYQVEIWKSWQRDHSTAKKLPAKKLLERKIGPETKDTIVTAAQRYIEQGRQEGRQEGRQGALLDLLQLRFANEVDAQVERRIATASVEQVETWTRRVLSATTLSEVISD